MRTTPGIVNLLLLCWNGIGIDQDSSTSTHLTNVLESRVKRVEIGSLSVRNAAAQVLRGAAIPGGIELVHCSERLPLIFIDPEASVQSALSQVSLMHGNLSLSISNEGVLNLRETRQPPAVLDVRMAAIEIPKLRPGDNAMGAVRRLLETPEVRAKISELGLQEGRVELGFSKLRPPSTQPDPPISLRGVTVRDDRQHQLQLPRPGHGCSG